MLTKHLSPNKILDIRLEEEKFYFPGETIKGFVVVTPKSAIKINGINLQFYGQVFIHLKEKETTTLFRNAVKLPIYPETATTAGNNTTDKKTVTLEAMEHCFPFQFTVPKNLNLPSSMEFGKKAHIRYMINALLDRPMIPESLCPRIEYYVHLLEYIDIEQSQFRITQERCQDMMLPKAKYNEKCMVRASIPRLGFTRGDIIPVKVLVDHFTSCQRKNGIFVDLVRTVEIRTSRHTVFKESVLKTTCYDLDIKEEDGKQQSILCQLLIPTSTPPSIRYKDKVVRFLYKVRITVSFTSNKNTICVLDLPFVIGTWPRAAIPIDDDDDEEEEDDDVQVKEDGDRALRGRRSNHNDNFVDTDLDEDDIESLRTCSIDDASSIHSNQRYSSNIVLPSWYSNNNLSLPTVSMPQPHPHPPIRKQQNRNSMMSSYTADDAYNFVNRSDSLNSKRSNNSLSSCHSSPSYEHYNNGNPSPHYPQQPHSPYSPHYAHQQHLLLQQQQQQQQQQNNLSRHTSQSTTVSSPDRLPSYYNNNNNNAPSAMGLPFGHHTHHHSMTSHHRKSPSSSTIGTDIYSYSPTVFNPTTTNNYNNTVHHSPTLAGPKNGYYQPGDIISPTPIRHENDVPTHILEPISNHQHHQQHQQLSNSCSASSPTIAEEEDGGGGEADEEDFSTTSSSSLGESDEDEDDLLAIIERKKKKERRDLRRKRKEQRLSQQQKQQS